MKRKLGGLYVITDEKLIARGRYEEAVELALRGGASIVQLREKRSNTADTIELGRRILGITQRYNVPLIINDSPALAREIGAEGVHLGEDDCTIEEARAALGEDAIIGVSCYNKLERGLDAERAGAGYVAFGTPYYTPTKPEREPTPLETLREAVRKIKSIPIFAIGGITKENAPDILETGVDGIAVITSVFASDDILQSASDLASLMNS